MTSQHDKAKRWRPWQFSLRTLLLIMFGIACFLGGWTANEWKRRREMERAQQEDEARFSEVEAAITSDITVP